MQRRRYLELLGIGTGGTFAGEVRMFDEHNQEGNEDQNGDEGGRDSEDDGPDSETPFGDAAIANPNLVDHELVFEQGEAYALATIENTGGAPSGELGVAVEWLDDSGAFLNDRQETLGWLNAGEVWRPRIRSLEDADDVAEINVAGAYRTEYPAVPAPITVVESEYEPDETTAAISGRAENDAETDVSEMEVFGRVFDEAGRVMAGGSELEFDVPAGRDWAFEISLRELERPYDVVTHDVVLDANLLAMSEPE